MADRYTPEQVAALSDAELSEAVLTHVLNVPPHDGETWDGAFWWKAHQGLALRYPTKKHWANGAGFSPDEPRAVDFVLEQMRRRWKETTGDFRWSLRSGDGCWAADVEGQVAGWLPVVSIIAPTLGRAVFEAAVISAQSLPQPVVST